MVLLAAFARPVLADAVTDWNAFADTISSGPNRTRVTAMMHIAMHDALNSIAPRYESYTDIPRQSRHASPEAAVGQAAFRVLATSAPTQLAAITTFYNNWALTLPDCPSTACAEGVLAGDAAADAILALRTGDGSATPNLPYSQPVSPGVYQPTPPSPPAQPLPLVVPQFAGWAHVTPFVLNDASQFRPEPSRIFDLKSFAYTRDYLEVKRVGDINAEAAGNRTTDQSEIARFWPGGGANVNLIARLVATGRGLDLWEHARLFALLNIAVMDFDVSVFDTKYTYNFWRPITAIRAGDTDGNPFTIADPAWFSYLSTPAYPDFTCRLPGIVSSGAEVLRRYFGTDALPFTITAAGLTRSYGTLSEAVNEAVDARVFAGIHFRTGCRRGAHQGAQVARFVVQHSLKQRNYWRR